MLCDLYIFSGKVYPPKPPHAQSHFGDGKCGRGEWQEKNCYEESYQNAEQLCAAPS